MVKGIETFKTYFKEYADEYVLIGGAACDILFDNSDASFRVTRDLDMVLIVEALSKEFGEAFWSFVKDGGYRNKSKTTGESQFYRFSAPANQEFPKMIELFARTDWMENEQSARKSSFSKLLFFRAIPRDPVIMMSTISLKLRTADVSIRFKAHCIFKA